MAIEGLLPVIPTPFRDGRFDGTSFQRLLDHMLPQVDGYTLLGSTGEAPSLTREERMEIAAAALSMTPEGTTVVVGVSHTSASESAALAKHAQQHGASGVLCSAPYYFENEPDGILRYLSQIDAAIDIEIVLYDNPVSTRTSLDASDVISWSRTLEHLGAVKLTDHDLGKVACWQEAGLRVYAGDDPIAFRYLEAGVDGVMIIAPAVFPVAFRDLWNALRSGDAARAFEIYACEVLPFVHVFGIGDEIATTKAILAEIGVFASAELRAPLVATSDARLRLLRLGYDLGVAAHESRVQRLATKAAGT